MRVIISTTKKHVNVAVIPSRGKATRKLRVTYQTMERAAGAVAALALIFGLSALALSGLDVAVAKAAAATVGGAAVASLVAF